jgi:DNA-binding response OmpR family regulator
MLETEGTLMLQELSIEVVSVSDVPFPSPEKHCPVVLVVDDEEVIAITLAAILRNHGFAPLTAFDGRSALEIAEVIPPELLISDVMMPGMNGIELAIAMSQRIPDCQVLLFSGQSATLDLLATARAEGHDFMALTKPLNPDVLLARIRECLRIQKPVSGGVDDERAGKKPGKEAFASSLY